MWNFAIQHAVHIINRNSSPLLNYKCPYEILHNKPSTFIHLKVFGCLSYAITLQAHRTKLSPRACKAVFLGYKEGTKGYILYDLASHQLFISRNVLFYKSIFPFHSTTTPDANPLIPQRSLTNSNLLDDPPQHHAPYPPPTQTPSVQTTSLLHPAATRHSTGIGSQIDYLQDCHCSLKSCFPNPSLGNVSYLISSFLSYTHCSPSYRNFCFSVSTNLKPRTFTRES